MPNIPTGSEIPDNENASKEPTPKEFLAEALSYASAKMKTGEFVRQTQDPGVKAVSIEDLDRLFGEVVGLDFSDSKFADVPGFVAGSSAHFVQNGYKWNVSIRPENPEQVVDESKLWDSTYVFEKMSLETRRQVSVLELHIIRTPGSEVGVLKTTIFDAEGNKDMQSVFSNAFKRKINRVYGEEPMEQIVARFNAGQRVTRNVLEDGRVVHSYPPMLPINDETASLSEYARGEREKINSLLGVAEDTQDDTVRDAYMKAAEKAEAEAAEEIGKRKALTRMRGLLKPSNTVDELKNLDWCLTFWMVKHLFGFLWPRISLRTLQSPCDL